MSDTAQTHLGSSPVQGLEYVVLGVATCFQQDQEGRLVEVLVAEPVPAADLDCLAQERRSTSYVLLYATTYAEIVNNGIPTLPAEVFPPGVLLGEDFVERVQAAAPPIAASPSFAISPCTKPALQNRGCSGSITASSPGGSSMRSWK